VIVSAEAVTSSRFDAATADLPATRQAAAGISPLAVAHLVAAMAQC
jgi:hypothetical protein